MTKLRDTYLCCFRHNRAVQFIHASKKRCRLIIHVIPDKRSAIRDPVYFQTMPENFEKLGSEAPEEIPEQPELETKPEHMEMPDDLVEPEGKSGKWSEVVENKELGVRYREKVIELPKHRQQETGIKRIRRRELLPPFPEGLCGRDKNGNFYAETGERKLGSHYGERSERIDKIYNFLTDEAYPSNRTINHKFYWYEDEKSEQQNSELKKFVDEGLYFQEIPTRENETVLYCSPKWTFAFATYTTPIFIFWNRNQNFNDYLDSLFDNSKFRFYDKELRKLRSGEPVREKIIAPTPSEEVRMPIVHDPAIKPLRWCHAECALVPTKRSLNVLFFETDEKRGAEEEK